MRAILTHMQARITFAGLALAVLFFVPFAHVSALTITPIKLELRGNPGQTIKQEITLYNEHDSTETLYVSYANIEASGETGNPAFLEPSEGLGTWMQAAEKVSILPKSSQIVPLTITVPTNAEPGGYFAAVFWGTVPPSGAGNQVSIGAKTGVLVLLSVAGDVNEQGGIVEFATKNKEKLYTSLPVTFYYRFQNNGGDRVKPEGDIRMKNMFGLTSARVPGNPVDGNVLPGSTRKIETVWKGKDGTISPSEKNEGNFFTKVGREWRNFGLGRYSANIALAYGVRNQVSTAHTSFWVLPWHLLIFLAVLGVIAYFIISRLVRRYNRWVIGRAEEMLKREQEKTKRK